MTRGIILVLIYIAFTFYGFQAVKTVTKSVWIHYLFLGIAVLIIGNFIYQFLTVSEGRVLTPAKSYAFGFLLAFMALNLVMIPLLLAEDIIRFILGVYDKVVTPDNTFYLPERRKFLSAIALGLGALPFVSLLYGMYKGKYNYKVLKYQLYFEDLPAAFDGYKLTHISDIHSGSFDNRKKIEYGVGLINQQESDVILFTGDIVNNKAIELEPWADLFSTLKAKDGVYSVLGNHDYGDYVDWPLNDKEQNLQNLIALQGKIGFKLLLNDSTYLEKNGDRIALIGVENWGKGGFKKAGDLKLATRNVQPNDFKILMSHDPSHWEECVIHDKWHYHLTLSGHTHGMQFGIEIPGWVKWSPVKWRYTYWAGIYEEMNQFINVNRGFGYLGYPGRVGIWPEITVIELKRGSKTT